MKYKTHILPIIILLVTACTGGDDEATIAVLDRAEAIMEEYPDSAYTLLYNIDSLRIESDDVPTSLRARYYLLLGTAMNKTDRPMAFDYYQSFSRQDKMQAVCPSGLTKTFDSLFQHTVVDYYDRHGTANEQMRSRYILGCICRDMHESPRAIEWYLSATDCADTLSSDCDYLTLMRIYGQMAYVYHHQLMSDQELDAWKQYSKYAAKCGNNDEYIRGIELQLDAYNTMHDTEKIFTLTDSIRHLYLQNDMHHAAARVFPTAIMEHLRLHNYAEAKKLMDIFETESDLFDSDGNIASNYSYYYLSKGWYYRCVGQLDSSEFYYRRLLSKGFELDGNRGLLDVSIARHIADSINVYAQRYENAVAKTETMINAQAVQNAKSMYDYSRNQQIAYEEHIKAQNRLVYIWMILAISGFAIILLSVIYLILCNKYRTQKKNWSKQMSDRESKLKKAEADIENNANEYQRRLNLKEKEIASLNESRKELKKSIKPRDNAASLSELKSSDIVDIFHKYSEGKRQGAPTGEEWKSLGRQIDKLLPSIQLQMSKNRLSKDEKRVCYLSIIDIKPTSVSLLMNKTTAQISNLRKSANLHLFNDPSAATLYTNLLSGIN